MNLLRKRVSIAAVAILTAPLFAVAAFAQQETTPQAPPQPATPPTAAPAPPPPDDPLGADLFQAISYGTAADVKALLAKGAQVEGKNWLGITPLMWAATVGKRDICVALVEAGANVNTSGRLGTALNFAEMGGNADVVRYLVAKGAVVTKDRADEITPLMTAAENGRVDLMRLLIARSKADVNAPDAEGTTPLMYAARRGQSAAVRFLLSAGAKAGAKDIHGRTALMYAAQNGYPECVTLLAPKAGGSLNARDKAGNTALHLAARYTEDAVTLRALLRAGADRSAKDARGRTALGIARARGNSVAATVLRGGSGAPGRTTVSFSGQAASSLEQQARTAAERGLRRIEQSSATFAERATCVSCHHEGLGLMASGLAKERGLRFDRILASAGVQKVLKGDEAVADQVQAVVPNPALDKHIPGNDMGEVVPMVAFVYSGLLAQGQPAGETQSALMAIAARQQAPDGHFGFLLRRAPVQSSLFTTTALTVQLLKAYMPKDRAAETATRLAKAQKWLLATKPVTNEDRAFRLLGLKWAGAPAAEVARAAAELRAAQRPDGGWAQEGPVRSGADAAYTRSDAYATGQALYALHVGGGVPTTSETYRRGVKYLLRTQDDDGSWFVNKRAIPGNTYFDGGFPHGQSQYISYGASCWATMALTLAAQPEAPGRLAVNRP